MNPEDYEERIASLRRQLRVHHGRRSLENVDTSWITGKNPRNHKQLDHQYVLIGTPNT